MTPLEIAVKLGKTGLCICPEFLNPQELKDLGKDFHQMRRPENFKGARVGQENPSRQDLIRSDEIHWLERESATLVQENLWNQLDSLKQAFNRTLFLGLQKFDGHYANYPKGGFYRRHLDSLPVKNNRKISLILYLNENWQPADGGRLRIYEGQEFTDVDPVGGTLVCFMSEYSEHEVCESYSPRFSFTGWFTDSIAF